MDAPETVRIAELDSRADLRAASALACRLWRGPSPGSPNTLAALACSGNYVAGAFVGDRLVGACFGWLGRRDGREFLFSRLNAVDPPLQNRGVGFRIKQHQRAWALERGIDLIQWTFDPLLARNAYFALQARRRRRELPPGLERPGIRPRDGSLGIALRSC